VSWNKPDRKNCISGKLAAVFSVAFIVIDLAKKIKARFP
jgi:hypothetical protein